MTTQIFVNLPVHDLDASMRFFRALGYDFNPQFTDDSAACLVISDVIHAMLLTHDRFGTFTPNPVCDARKQTEVLIALSMPDRETVDAIVTKAVAAGGKTYAAPRDHGFMYEHGFQDLDGHIWEVFHMDMAALPAP